MFAILHWLLIGQTYNFAWDRFDAQYKVVVAAYLVVKRLNFCRSPDTQPEGAKIKVDVASERSPSNKHNDNQALGPPDLYYFPVESTPRKYRPN